MVFSFHSKILKKQQLTPDVILLSFSIPEDFTFKAGQFVTIRFEKEGELKPRSYSILNPPSQEGSLDICIKIVDGGFASEVLANTKKGDEYDIKGPFGHFTFDEETENDHWFIGAGTGVAPLYSMIKQYKPKGGLIFGTKTQQDLLFHEEFKTMKQLQYIPTLTKEEWDGKKGRVQEHLPDDVKDKTFYICGLKELVLETKELLLKKGVDPHNIKFERYS